MKIIGIFGKSGAGKTTLSKLIQSYDAENIEVLHLDTIFDSLKKKVFKGNVIEQTDSDKNKIVTVNPSFKSKIMENRVIGAIVESSAIRTAPGNIIIRRKIARAKKKGKKAFIIEGIHLNNFKSIESADVIIKIDAPFIKRLNRVRKRENNSVDKEKMVLRDKIFFKNKKNKYKYLIKNNGDIEKLREYAKHIYNTEIKDKTKINLLRQKYGGYKVKAIRTPLVKQKKDSIPEK